MGVILAPSIMAGNAGPDDKYRAGLCGAQPEGLRSLARTIGILRRRVGYEAEMVPTSRQRREVGSDFHHGGQVLHGPAPIHGAMYYQDLLERVVLAGVGGLRPHQGRRHRARGRRLPDRDRVTRHTGNGLPLADTPLIPR